MSTINHKSRALWGERIHSVDLCKGVGIILVIVGHCIGYVVPDASYVNDFINSFHMPLFFMLGGVVYKRTGIKRAIVRKILTLFIPLIIYKFINMLLRMFFLQYVTIPAMIQLGGHWFIFSFLGASLLYILLDHILTRHTIGVISCAFLCMALVISNIDVIDINKFFLQTLVGFFFYNIGAVIRPIVVQYKGNKKVIFLITGALLLIMGYFIPNDVSVRMYRNVYGSPVLFVWRALCGCLGTMCICLVVGKNVIIEEFGKNSLIIMSVQFSVYLWCAKLAEITIGLKLLGEFPYICIYILIVLILSYAVGKLIDKYLPLLAGHWTIRQET